MNNVPEVKIGIAAVSRDCFPMSLSERRRKELVEAYRPKYGDIYECPTVIENELHMKKALAELNEAGCNALVVFLGNFGTKAYDRIDLYRTYCAAGKTASEDLRTFFSRYELFCDCQSRMLR